MRDVRTAVVVFLAVASFGADRPPQAPVPPQAPPIPYTGGGTPVTPVLVGPETGRGSPPPVAYTYRQPVGHSHTCSRCGTTWDHQSNPTHSCRTCGAVQFVQDPVPRPVLVQTAVRGEMPASASVSPAEYPRAVTPTTYYTLPVYGGCAGGNCPAPARPALLPWR